MELLLLQLVLLALLGREEPRSVALPECYKHDGAGEPAGQLVLGAGTCAESGLSLHKSCPDMLSCPTAT